MCTCLCAMYACIACCITFLNCTLQQLYNMNDGIHPVLSFPPCNISIYVIAMQPFPPFWCRHCCVIQELRPAYGYVQARRTRIQETGSRFKYDDSSISQYQTGFSSVLGQIYFRFQHSINEKPTLNLTYFCYSYILKYLRCIQSAHQYIRAKRVMIF